MPLTAKIAGVAVLLASLAPLALQFGVSGAAVAYALGNMITLGVMTLALWRQYKLVRG